MSLDGEGVSPRGSSQRETRGFVLARDTRASRGLGLDFPLSPAWFGGLAVHRASQWKEQKPSICDDPIYATPIGQNLVTCSYLVARDDGRCGFCR